MAKESNTTDKAHMKLFLLAYPLTTPLPQLWIKKRIYMAIQSTKYCTYKATKGQFLLLDQSLLLRTNIRPQLALLNLDYQQDRPQDSKRQQVETTPSGQKTFPFTEG